MGPVRVVDIQRQEGIRAGITGKIIQHEVGLNWKSKFETCLSKTAYSVATLTLVKSENRFYGKCETIPERLYDTTRFYSFIIQYSVDT